MREVILARNRLEGLLQNTIRSFGEFGWMLSANDQDFVRATIEQSRDTAASEESSEVRYSLEQLEKAARMITDAMFRPTGLQAGDHEQKPEEDDVPVSEVL